MTDTDTDPLLDSKEFDGFFEYLGHAIHANARAKGFYAADDEIARILRNLDRKDLVVAHHQNATLKRHALIDSEMGEMTEAVRKPSLEGHLEGFSLQEEEAADVLIRLLDYCQDQGIKLGPAVRAKMRFNAGRPYLHGKLS